MTKKYHYTKPAIIDSLPVETGRRPEDYEFQILTIDRSESRSSTRTRLTEAAEYGKWELARTRLYIGGTRKVWLRRRILRMDSTLYSASSE